MQENKARLDEELSSKEQVSKPRIGTVPQKIKTRVDKNTTRIVLPKIRKKANMIEQSDNLSNVTSIKNNTPLPNLTKVHKSTHEMITKER